MGETKCTTQNAVTEWSYTSGRSYADPFNEIELDVVFTGAGGEWRVPAFWGGGNEWRVRFAPPAPGTYRFRTACSDKANADLHGREGTLEASAYTGDNPLLAHGAPKVAQDRRHFEHADGTPFFWLADTWWMGLTKRLGWPDDFQLLAADRVAKGFNVIQIVAGLYPDMPPFDERGANEAGFPWEPDYARINPAYFDMADLRIQWLVRSGLVPCIVGSWSYFGVFMGAKKLKKHWRYLVARWGAYPVVWCLAGEWTMPYYLSEDKDGDEKRLRETWAEVARYVKRIDAFQRLRSVHEGHSGREIGEAGLIDFQMLQTGHGGHRDIPNTLTRVTESVAQQPKMPVIDSEVSYEGIGGGCWEDVQRFMFWTCLLSGAAGHTYGANGIWQMSTPREPYGPSPHGLSWGNTPWETAYRLPGSEQVGIGKRLLERYEWWRLEPDFDAVQPRWSPQNYYGPYAARIPGQCRIIFLPTQWMCPVVRGLDRSARYRAFLFDLATGHEYDCGCFTPDSEGQWSTGKSLPIAHDLVLVVEEVK